MSRSIADRAWLWCKKITVSLIALVGIVCAVLALRSYVQEATVLNKSISSAITQRDDIEISGFYGPGAWLAWLITAGMAYGHIAVALFKKGEITEEWDYDLLALSLYTDAAAIDLIAKAVIVLRHPEDETLLPALMCAERAVSVGMGTAFLGLIVNGIFGKVLGMRTMTCVITCLLCLIACFVTSRAHATLARTSPVVWCSLHNWQPREVVDVEFLPPVMEFGAIIPVPFTAVDALAPEWEAVWDVLLTYGDWKAWVFVLATMTFGTLVVFTYNAAWRKLGPRQSLRKTLKIGGIIGICGIGLPVFLLASKGMRTLVAWALGWFFLGWIVFIFAFVPQLGYFPPSNISLLEMDQFFGFLVVLCAAVLRTSRFAHPYILEKVIGMWDKDRLARINRVDASYELPMRSSI